ncbi:hypothetical protein [Mesobacillus subterraneus]|uniref:Lipoprotein n=1 Tax=Mesobacillus subterraneus TaxID=285983 RepID=A0A427TWJ3_9BACI|nr:hypothetical protein [Mesobacillus subterraneus]RSD28833.1 hypothetical protein EJA10_04480 [Mesobacillus subterraneus]
MRLLTFATLILFLLTGCSSNFEPKLTRIDVQRMSSDGTKIGEEKIIPDKQTLDQIENAFAKIKWEPNTKAEMVRREDVLAIFFIQEEKNMPESLYEYRVWFQEGTATIISNKENEGYGRLTDEKEVQFLKSEFMIE